MSGKFIFHELRLSHRIYLDSTYEEDKPAESASTSGSEVHHSFMKMIGRREIGRIGNRFKSSAIEARCSQMERSGYGFKSDTGILTFTAEDNGVTFLLGGNERLWRPFWNGTKFCLSANDVCRLPSVTSMKASPTRPGFAIWHPQGPIGTLDIINVLAKPSITSMCRLLILAMINTADYFPSGTRVAIGTNRGLGVSTPDIEWFEWVGHCGIGGSHVVALKTYQNSEDNLLCCGYRDGRVKLVDLRDKTQSTFLYTMPSAVCSILLPSNGFHIVTSALNGSVWLSDTRFRWKEPIFSFANVNSRSYLQLGIDPTETIITSGGEDRAARFWSLKSGKLLHTETGFSSNPTAVHWPSKELAGKWVQGKYLKAPQGPFFGCMDKLYSMNY